MYDKFYEKIYEKRYGKTKQFLIASAPYFLSALVIGIAGAGMISIAFYTPSPPINWNWNGVGMFVAICAGIGWMFHGTGFLLVRVK